MPDTFSCIEVDSYGHFFMKAKTNLICNSPEPKWNEVSKGTLQRSTPSEFDSRLHQPNPVRSLTHLCTITTCLPLKVVDVLAIIN